MSRPAIGHDLLAQALTVLNDKTPPAPAVPFISDTWSCPFTVCYLNVGRRHLIGSLSAVVDLVLKHRPDILFLGDLVASRCHIGKL